MEDTLYNDIVKSIVDDINGNPQKVREMVIKVLRYELFLKGISHIEDNMENHIRAKKALEVDYNV